ncbi:MAG: iron ABC transporter permease [Oscillospiraceae bacterium]|nr:iron ABC transporter permease [Candidatus Limimonas egerieequi]
MSDNVELDLKNVEKKTSPITWVIMIVLPFVLFFVSLFLGRYMINPSDVAKILIDQIPGVNITPTWETTAETVVLRVRFPRAVMAALVGAGLSMSGAAFQGMFQNPLVSPYVLGVSAGASCGAAFGLLMSWPTWMVQIVAFAFGILAVAITYSMAHLYKTTPILMLVLSGMVVSAFFQAMVSLIKFAADDEDKLPAITFWLMGSIGKVGLDDLAPSAIPMILAMVVLYAIRWRLNVLSMGEREAETLGVNTERVKLVVIITTTLISSLTVSLCGIIGWVGQVIPHFCRMIVGPNHKALIPATIFVGASYIIVIDNLCRLVSITEIPIGILTSVVGAPVFAYLLRKTKGGWA